MTKKTTVHLYDTVSAGDSFAGAVQPLKRIGSDYTGHTIDLVVRKGYAAMEVDGTRFSSLLYANLSPDVVTLTEKKGQPHLWMPTAQFAKFDEVTVVTATIGEHFFDGRSGGSRNNFFLENVTPHALPFEPHIAAKVETHRQAIVNSGMRSTPGITEPSL